MKITRLSILTLVYLSFAGGLAEPQQPPYAGNAPQRKPASYASVVKEGPGRQVLVVDYLWQAHARASVEIFLADEDQAEPATASPVFFRSQHFKGEMVEKLYRCQDRSARGTNRETHSDEKTEFEILGRRNGLNKLSTCVVAKTLDDRPVRGAAAVFCLLDSWSVDRKLLCLEPPREYFSRAGELHVWFLRDDRILWQQTVAWPGY